MTKDVMRYSFYIDRDMQDNPCVEDQEDPVYGEWVKYDDVKHLLPPGELEALRIERYRLRSALGAIIGLFHDSDHEAKNIARRVLDSSAVEPLATVDAVADVLTDNFLCETDPYRVAREIIAIVRAAAEPKEPS